MKCLRVTKIVKEVKFEGVWSSLGTERCTRDNHSWGVGHCGRGLISAFEEFFASIGKVFILAGEVGTGL